MACEGGEAGRVSWTAAAAGLHVTFWRPTVSAAAQSSRSVAAGKDAPDHRPYRLPFCLSEPRWMAETPFPV